MNPYNAYRQQQHAGWTRIDLLLALYDGAIDRVDRALSALQAGDAEAARPHLIRFQAIVTELAAGINFDAQDASSSHLMRLYEFFAHSASTGDRKALDAARRCLATVREGFQAIRGEALQLERGGAIPPLAVTQQVVAMG